MRVTSLAILGLLLCSNAAARADWIGDAWNEDGALVGTYGNPSITVGPDGISIVLTEATLDAAGAANLSPTQTIAAFLGRYGPRFCNSLFDFNVARKNMRVELLIQHSMPLEATSETTGSEVRATMKNLKKLGGSEGLHAVGDNVFEVDFKGKYYEIDYVPSATDPSHCSTPHTLRH